MNPDAEHLPLGFAWEVLREARRLTGSHFWKLGWLLSLALLPEAVYFLCVAGGEMLSFYEEALADPMRAMDNLAEIAAATPAWGGWRESLSIVISLPLCVGFLGAVLRLIRGEKASWREIVSPLRNPAHWPSALARAVRQSGERTRGAKGPLLLLLVLLAAANAVGFLLPLGIGLLYTIPLSCVALVLCYERLKVRHTILD